MNHLDQTLLIPYGAYRPSHGVETTTLHRHRSIQPLHVNSKVLKLYRQSKVLCLSTLTGDGVLNIKVGSFIIFKVVL
jgi:hypothetical protein